MDQIDETQKARKAKIDRKKRPLANESLSTESEARSKRRGEWIQSLGQSFLSREN